jgi:hypothetical protein
MLRGRMEFALLNVRRHERGISFRWQVFVSSRVLLLCRLGSGQAMHYPELAYLIDALDRAQGGSRDHDEYHQFLYE